MWHHIRWTDGIYPSSSKQILTLKLHPSLQALWLSGAFKQDIGYCRGSSLAFPVEKPTWKEKKNKTTYFLLFFLFKKHWGVVQIASLISGFLMNFFFSLLRTTVSEEGLSVFNGQTLIFKVNKTDNENLYWLLGIYRSEGIFSVYSKISSATYPWHLPRLHWSMTSSPWHSNFFVYFLIHKVYVYTQISNFENYYKLISSAQKKSITKH